MAAPWSAPEVYKHHEQHKVCVSRPKYREGRKARAVKVYTINLESCYLMVQGVPAIGVMTELIQLCALYGVVEEYRPLDEYPAEEFTEVYLVKFQKLTSARAAKRHMDEKSFYGGVLHVCYVPEYETVEDTRLKLQDRRRYVFRATQNKVRQQEQEELNKELTADKTSTSEIVTTHCQTYDNENTGESSNISHFSSFPPLPLPPQEHSSHRQENLYETVQTEDKMGTLHNAIADAKQQPMQSSSSSKICDHIRPTEHRLSLNQAPTVRFTARTTQLQNRKRKIENFMENSLITGTNVPLIGPQLPESPKLDMEDESLNTTVSLIRKTMNQVTSVPDLKQTEKKLKPRRRI
ncbi:RNA-binding protein 48 isoform X2 [Thalassophryne amazonica]|uniref:RNA-binding protein 48 isoform X2 n=1 Tax=Thalassophryne amazonica TaxID=390379 RepID=UPI0014712046|nr:RNA-binding protein 48 isoform X2 [Thalassophryne amazonica]